VLGRFWEAEPRADLAAHTAGFVELDQTMSLDAYVDTMMRARSAGHVFKLGLEVDFFPSTIDAVMDLLAPYPWDVLVVSIHWVGGWAIDSSPQAHEFTRRGVERAWADYFAVEAELAGSGLVDVLGHVDVCKKYGYRPAAEPVHLYETVVEAAARSGTAVEVSSQGLRNPAGEVYPSPTLLAMFQKAGVGITLASDAHEASQVGWGHDAVVAAARAAGYATRLTFDRRTPAPSPLL